MWRVRQRCHCSPACFPRWRSSSRRDGYLEGSGFQVTWAIGHLVGLAMPEEINPAWKAWTRQALPMLPDSWPLRVLDGGAAQFRTVKRLLGARQARVDSRNRQRPRARLPADGHLARSDKAQVLAKEVQQALNTVHVASAAAPATVNGSFRSRARAAGCVPAVVASA